MAFAKGLSIIGRSIRLGIVFAATVVGCLFRTTAAAAAAY